jgi:hypothetical protein
MRNGSSYLLVRPGLEPYEEGRALSEYPKILSIFGLGDEEIDDLGRRALEVEDLVEYTDEDFEEIDFRFWSVYSQLTSLKTISLSADVHCFLDFTEEGVFLTCERW